MLRSVRTEHSQGVQDFCVLLVGIPCIQECLCCQAHQGMPLNNTHILTSRGCFRWPEQAGTGTPFRTLATPSPWDVHSPWLEAQFVLSSNNPSSAPLQHSCTCASPLRRCLQKPLCVGSGTSAGSADPNSPARSRSWSAAHSWIGQRCCSERASPKEGNLATHQHFNEGSDIHLPQSRE